MQWYLKQIIRNYLLFENLIKQKRKKALMENLFITLASQLNKQITTKKKITIKYFYLKTCKYSNL